MALGAILAAASLAINIGSAIVGHNAQNKQARGSANAANDAATTALNALNARTLEERIAARAQIEQGGRQAMSAASLARLSAISAGIGGQSAEALTQTIEGDLGRFTDSIDQNLEFTLFQSERQAAGIDAERRARIAAVPKANLWLTALQIGGSVVDFMGTRAAKKPPKA